VELTFVSSITGDALHVTLAGSGVAEKYVERLPASGVHPVPPTLIDAPALEQALVVPWRVLIVPVVHEGAEPTVHEQSHAPMPATGSAMTSP
jgi:hypothetical protein